jgi:PAS domain S-box-containing protein
MPVKKDIHHLLVNTLIFYLLKDSRLEKETNENIAKLKNAGETQLSGENKTDLEICISHAEIILKLKPEVDGLIREAIALPTDTQIEEMIKLYDSSYNQSLRLTNYYRLFLYVFSILLLAYIAYIIIRLNRATKELNTLNESLEQRVQERTEELLWSNAELQRSEANNSALLHALPDSMWRTNINGDFLDLIPSKDEQEIILRENWVGKTIFDVLPEAAANQILERAQKSLTTGETQILEYQLERNEEVYHYESRITVCGDSEILTMVRDITEGKKVAEALRENEAKYRDLFDNAPVAYHELDTEGRFVRINHTEELLLGYTSEELKGRHPWEIIVEKTSREATKAKLTGKQQLQAVERTFIRKDGKLISVLNEDRMIYDKDGKVSGIRSTLQDITHRKRVEAEALVISEIIQGVSMTSNLKELLKHIHSSISKLLYAENCFVALYNPADDILDLPLFVDKYDTVTPNYKLGKGMTSYVFRNERPMLLTQEKIQQLIEDGEIEVVGTPPAVWLGVPLRSPKGIIGVLVVQHYEDANTYNLRDLELLTSVGDQIALAIERKRAEEALKASEERFQSAFDCAPIGICLTSPTGHFQQVNHSLCEIVGYTKEELLTKSFRDITHPDDLAVSNAAFNRLISGELKTCRLEKRYIHKLGHQILALTSLSLVCNSQNDPIYIIAQTQDITEQKFLEEQLHRGQKLESIGQLAAGIAHEINTPTQYVGDNTRFLRDSFNDLAKVLKKTDELLEDCRQNGVQSKVVAELEEIAKFTDTEYLIGEIPVAIEEALSGVERIGKIVQSMKDFAHPGVEDRQAADLNRAIESTITVASNEWKYVAEMVTDFDPTLPPVPCFIGEFNQVVLNMIVNAAHAIADVVGHTGQKGVIKIGTKLEGDWAEIRISDTGAGIPEEIRKKIFDPFFTTKEVGKGTGQGLAISHAAIVEKHKGTIALESKVGNGTTFIIKLPLKEELS